MNYSAFRNKGRILNCIKIVSIVYFSLSHFNIIAQCISSGPRSPTITANDASVGTIAWSNTGNVMTTDNLRATATSTAVILGGQRSNYLVTTGYGFSIPATATVCGIHVEVEKSASAFFLPTAYVEDSRVRIVKGGTIYPTDIMSGVNWGSLDDYDDHGNNAEAWGTTWTPAEINASDFGVAVSARMVSILSLFPTARINHIQVTVYYDEFLPIDLLDLSASRLNDEFIEVSWTSKEQVSGEFLILEYRGDGASEWEELQLMQGDGELNYRVLHQYSSGIGQSLYYRVKKIGLDGVVDYSSIITYENKVTSSSPKIYPIPTTGKFTIESVNEIQKIEIINIFGTVIYESGKMGKIYSIDIGEHSHMETFFVKTYIGDRVEVKRIVIE